MSKITKSRIAIILSLALIMGLFTIMVGCQKGEETPTPAPTTATEPTVAPTGEETPAAGTGAMEIKVEELMKLADENGKDEAEKYGNAVFVTSTLTGFVLMEYGTGLMGLVPTTPGTDPNAPATEPNATTGETATEPNATTGETATEPNATTGETATEPNATTGETATTGEVPEISDEAIAKFKEIAEKDKATLEEIKAALEAFKVPEGNKEIHDKIIECYAKLLEGVTMAIEAADKKDFKAIGESSKPIQDGSKLMEEAMQGISEKGYKPGEAFQKAVEEKFKM